MLQFKWSSVTITTNQQANAMIETFNRIKPRVGGFDTETNSLHPKDKYPFLFQFGFLDFENMEGYTYAVDIERQPNLSRQVIEAWTKLAETLEIYLAHNIKYDLGVMINYGVPYTKENISDTMFYIRYGHDALTPKNGGPPLGLKAYAAMYIDRDAKHHERLLSSEKTNMVKELHIKLKYRLRNCKVPPNNIGARSYTLGLIAELFKDPTADYNELPPDAKEAYLTWLREDVPLYMQEKVTSLIDTDMIQYNKLDRTNVITYGHYDIIYMLEIFARLEPIVINRGNMAGIEAENAIIYPLLEMELAGFATDKEYVEECRVKLKAYIRERRKVLFKLAGQELSIGQHEVIKNILFNEYDVELSSTNSAEMDTVKSQLQREGGNESAIAFIDIVQELRTLEKWYSVYIMRFSRDLKRHDKLYTTINQVGTVSGRVTSDFQQFPKGGIFTADGEELFHPRKMIKPSGGDYDSIVYLDYSQIELRVQALYTILVGHPDTNLCRAYMPYKCINPQGVEFDYNNPEHIRDWDKEWYYIENPTEHWEPTDVHAATTEKATGLTKKDPGFKELRSIIGKRVNFAKNYGAQYKKIAEMFPDKTPEEVARINDSYYAAFPGVKEYHAYCYARAQENPCTANLFGIKYYGVSGHKLINMLVQGSSAFFLKWKIRQLYEYSKANNIKTKFQMNIHDELSWEHHKDDPAEIFFKFKEIMQEWEDTLVPIVAEMEATNTTWANKKGVETLNELQSYISS